jgi:hypothetical protein
MSSSRGGRGGGRSYGGLDNQRTTLIYQNRTPKPAYPAGYFLSPPDDPLDSENMRIIKMRSELTAYMKTSPFYLRKISSGPAQRRRKIIVERYSDRYSIESTSKDSFIGNEVHKINADLALIPEELHNVYDADRAIRYARKVAVKAAQMASSSAAQRRKAFLQQLLDAEKNEDPSKSNSIIYILFQKNKDVVLVKVKKRSRQSL